MQHMEAEGSPKGDRLRVAGSPKKNSYYGYLEEEGMTIVNGCSLCLRYGESVDHFMLNCKTAQSIWMTVVGWFDYC